jgi:hypothetical protein
MRYDTIQFISDAVLRGLSAAGTHLVFRSRADAGPGARTNGAAARRGLSGDRWDGIGCWRAPGASPAGDCLGAGVCGGDPAGRRIRPSDRATGFSAGTIRRDARTIGPDGRKNANHGPEIEPDDPGTGPGRRAITASRRTSRAGGRGIGPDGPGISSDGPGIEPDCRGKEFLFVAKPLQNQDLWIYGQI